MNLIIDIGNTRVKLAVFKGDSIVKQSICDLKELLGKVRNLKNNYPILKSILSSVVKLPNNYKEELSSMMDLLILSDAAKVPFQNQYKSPKTLGLDRIALVTAAVKMYPNQNCLIIDAGTCITYDFIDSKLNYHGGAISPGITMRYNALSDYTSKLPKLKVVEKFSVTGNDTKSSIHSGVLNGVLNEVKGVINQYKTEYSHLTVVLTGGDVNFLSKQLKNSIFANQNFLLVGLNAILNFNN